MLVYLLLFIIYIQNLIWNTPALSTVTRGTVRGRGHRRVAGIRVEGTRARGPGSSASQGCSGNETDKVIQPIAGI
jgi:hypothetical protein